MKQLAALIKLYYGSGDGVVIANSQAAAEDAYQAYTAVPYGESEKLDDAPASGTTIVPVEWHFKNTPMAELPATPLPDFDFLGHIGNALLKLEQDGVVDLSDFNLTIDEDFQELYEILQIILSARGIPFRAGDGNLMLVRIMRNNSHRSNESL